MTGVGLGCVETLHAWSGGECGRPDDGEMMMTLSTARQWCLSRPCPLKIRGRGMESEIPMDRERYETMECTDGRKVAVGKNWRSSRKVKAKGRTEYSMDALVLCLDGADVLHACPTEVCMCLDQACHGV
ncbi:hypothetical protein AXG93_4485s1150 [Marchantia polymorpha subsp. ruderalis]|uniref:Uncharacterized protein n=1 Tax=Marchantia polymorpha subsp. ruderalis TaxID=1480154 RepID=A0A176WFA5_MARPO|nr:hypothetical protein AXG93_4485s1150 [Marchantia polymorpha subsp. ruderalis]